MPRAALTVFKPIAVGTAIGIAWVVSKIIGSTVATASAAGVAIVTSAVTLGVGLAVLVLVGIVALVYSALDNSANANCPSYAMEKFSGEALGSFSGFAWTQKKSGWAQTTLHDVWDAYVDGECTSGCTLSDCGQGPCCANRFRPHEKEGILSANNRPGGAWQIFDVGNVGDYQNRGVDTQPYFGDDYGGPQWVRPMVYQCPSSRQVLVAQKYGIDMHRLWDASVGGKCPKPAEGGCPELLGCDDGVPCCVKPLKVSMITECCNPPADPPAASG